MRAIKTGLVVVAGVLLTSGCHGGSQSSETSAASAPAEVVVASTPSATVSPAAPPVAGVTTLDGTAFYQNGQALYSVKGTKPARKVTGADLFQQTVSPDGKHIAHVSQDGMVFTGLDGTSGRRTVKVAVSYHGDTTQPTYFWTADSKSVLIERVDKRKAGGQAEKTTAGTLRISDGTFTALPKSVQGGLNYRMSGDGKKLVYQKGCSISTANVDGSEVRQVPAIGLQSSAANPSRIEVCYLGPVNYDGTRATGVVFRMTDANNPGGEVPDKLLDLTTGKVLPIDVADEVDAVQFLRGDALLVRARPKGDGPYTLTLFAADGKKITSRTEPAIPDPNGVINFAGYAE
ncbi:hypothetical protein [Actinoplanes sp. L3-i22]|uniref:hypothetical protein n=1 Tax=Actinoplanes sp. L3-i22 TaxID=2836373 RepID=UPI001C798B6C|nr:hypothetical protein [Actinoplanes sp. L3-i22]BCY05763.1 hypothetical protein L3i22_008510 [Actinoplanes sp. L3-i22]